jgi:methyl-accepting chemotaxis protein-1 (serine sensor receptor)
MLKKRLSIRSRLALVVGTLTFLILIVGVLGLIGGTEGNATYRETYLNQMPSISAIDNAEILMLRERLVLDRAAFEIGKPASEVNIKRALELRTQSDVSWDRYVALNPEQTESDTVKSIAGIRKAIALQTDGFSASIRQNHQEDIAANTERLQAIYKDLTAQNEILRKHQFDLAENGYRNSIAGFGIFRITAISSLAFGLFAALYSYFSLSKAIMRPLNEALATFAAISSGNLRRTIIQGAEDEMGQLLRGITQMQKSLATTVQHVRDSSEAMSITSREIAAGNFDLSARTEQQASALEQTAASMEQMTSTVNQSDDNAVQAIALAEKASKIADRGNEVVLQVVSTMDEIKAHSSRISDIIAIIEGITFQTNILALNAAVEAARAGEQGRGFAVVASEVRALAQRSSAAAKDIKTLIGKSGERVNAGVKLVQNAGATMTEIIASVQRVHEFINDIAAGSREQSAGIAQISSAIMHIDQVTQKNVALVEEAAAATQSLEDQAESLRKSVAIFQLEERHILNAETRGEPVLSIA